MNFQKDYFVPMKVKSALFLNLLLFLIFNDSLYSATYLVTNTNDTGLGSLRTAITTANNNINSADTINFNIPGTGPFIIRPLSQLPQLCDPAGLFINGLTQPNTSSGNNAPFTANLLIELRGSLAGAAHGLWIISSNNKIQGLVIDSFEQDGIRIQGVPTNTSNNTIFCNFIGIDQLGATALGNGWNMATFWAGVNIVVVPGLVGFAFSNRVHRNLISGNYAEGVGISSCPPGDVYFNIVDSNFIGTDITGLQDRGNLHDGVYIGEGARYNTVADNLISGNDFEGVCIVGYAEANPPVNTHHNMVVSNLIGLNRNLAILPNSRDGVSVGIYGNIYQGGYANDNIISHNQIAHNGRNGIMVWEHFSSNNNADQNRFSQNIIYSNNNLGIDLANNNVTLNDPGDLDNGANQELNFPLITSAQYSAGLTTIQGTVDIGMNPTSAIIELYKANPDPAGYGEGTFFLTAVSPSSNNTWSVTLSGLFINDTITALIIDSFGNTSEFAQNIRVSTGIEESQLANLTDQSFEIYPNPTNVLTTIRYTLTAPSQINLQLFDITGRSLKTFIDEYKVPGNYSSNLDLRTIQNGVYFFCMQVENNKTIKRFVIIK